MTEQLDLFPPAAPAPLDHGPAAALAAQLPPGVRLGTSSWTFPGWAGIIYAGRPTQAQLVERGLSEYARHPLMTTVGIDRSYYAPLTDDELRRYAAQLPPGFPCVVKVPQAISSPVRGPSREANPDFLSVARLVAEVLEPLERLFRPHVGALLLQLPPLRAGGWVEPAALRARLSGFLQTVTPRFPVAVELRDTDLITPEHFELLAAAGASPCFNAWSHVPRIADQLRVAGTLAKGGGPLVARLLLPRGVAYAAAREAFAPFDRLHAVSDEMRADVVALARAAGEAGRPLFILVNNKAEGSSPLTVMGVAELLCRARVPERWKTHREEEGA